MSTVRISASAAIINLYMRTMAWVASVDPRDADSRKAQSSGGKQITKIHAAALVGTRTQPVIPMSVVTATPAAASPT